MRAAWSDYYGATVPLKLGSGLETGSPAIAAFGVGLFGGILAFFLTVVLCTFCSFFYGNVVIGIFTIAALAFAYLIRSHHKGIWRLPLGCCGLASIFVGVLLGRYCYGAYGYFALRYSNSRTYSNVDPAQRAASVADAGRIAFAAEAHVDAGRSAGYAAPDGLTYCAAPVLGLGQPGRVDFWAVGTDCCGTYGAFDCNDASDSSARGGAVVFDGPGSGPLGTVFGTRGGVAGARVHFAVARRKALAALGPAVVSANDALLVRWVRTRHLAMLPRYYAEQAWTFIAVATSVYAGLSAPLAWVTSRAAAAAPGMA